MVHADHLIMFLVLVVRGASGTLIWDRVATSIDSAKWVCQRDKFAIPAPKTADDANSFLVTLNSHSVSLVGNIAQVVELSL